MIYTIEPRHKVLEGEVKLPFSKSESNRVLIIRALSDSSFDIAGLSDAEDTRLLEALLKSQATVLDCGAAGTTFRFLTAYLACREGEVRILTGNERMKQRPVHILVEALNQMGADIAYEEEAGFPPLRINGKNIRGGRVALEGGISSQFISALLMIAPTLQEGLEVEIKGDFVSRPYVEMTIHLMAQFGVRASVKGNTITVPFRAYQPVDYHISPDWSAASYWFEAAALSESAGILLSGLKSGTFQGDERVAALFNSLGVISTPTAAGLMLTKNKHVTIDRDHFTCDFSDVPDLTQTMAVTFAALGISADIKGIANLRLKETDRIDAIQAELCKFGIDCRYEGAVLKVRNEIIEPKDRNIVIDTYNDHRMAMAFTPLALKLGKVDIRHPQVVEKSYPGYWREIEKFFLIHRKP